MPRKHNRPTLCEQITVISHKRQPLFGEIKDNTTEVTFPGVITWWV